MKKTTLLKNLILDEDIVVMPGVFDALSAVIAKKVGLKAICLGGYPTSASVLGKPDISLVTLTEITSHIRNISEAAEIPLLADGDTGHGGILNVRRTVSEFERAGAAGMIIEDQVFPKRCGHMDGKQVIPAEEMTAKLKAALDARTDDDFIITARTDAYAIHGLDEAINRANLYHETGADLIFVEAPVTFDEMRKINQEINAPTLANMVEGGKTPSLTAKELEEIGYNVVVFPVSALFAAATAVWNMFKTLSETGTTQGWEPMFQFDEFNELLDLKQHRQVESKF